MSSHTKISFAEFELAQEGDANLNSPIDLVYTWVDSSDLKWLATREEWFNRLGQGQLLSKKYSNNEELKFSLRSVSEFAPWVRKIFIVTADQQPDWLDLSHEKIQLVSHRDIYPDPADLPTFNSLSIETHIDRIPDLSEHYIYMNDDFFFGHDVEQNDFFSEQGKIIVYINSGEYPPELREENKHWRYLWAIQNADKLLDKTFSHERRQHIAHQAFAQTKSNHEAVRSSYPEELRVCSAQKFRSALDVMLQWHLLPYFALYRGDAVYSPTDLLAGSIYCDLCDSPTVVEQELQRIADKRPKFFCLNNGCSDSPTGLARGLELLNEFFPVCSEFERR